MKELSRREFCHVCNGVVKVDMNAALNVCPFCGADLANPDSETLCSSIECEHIKGFLGIGDGELYVTNKRLFFIKKKMGNTEGYQSVGAVGGFAAAIINKSAGKMEVNMPVENIGRIEDCRKGLRKGITLHTKSGESYNFFCSKPQELKDIFAPYIKG